MIAKDVLPTSVPSTLGDHQRRIQILEAVVPQAGAYLQARGERYSGYDFQALTSLNNYNGGNGASWYDGSWQWVDDATSPFEQLALETTVDADWFPFPLGNLGPEGAGYAVDVYFKARTDGGKVVIEFATTPVDEVGNTGGNIGSATSVVGPNDIEFNGAPAPGWYNTDNAADLSHTYKFSTYGTGGGAGWTHSVIERAPFYLGAADGTPLTGDAITDPGGTWEFNRDFVAGGGPDLEWWMRLKGDGAGTGGGTAITIGKVVVRRFNGSSNYV